MKNSNVLLIAIASAGLLLWLLLSGDDGPSWYYSYGEGDDEPFGTELFVELLEDRNDWELQYLTEHSKDWNLASDSLSTLLYFFSIPDLDSTHIYGLDSLIHEGHTLLISGLTDSHFLRWKDFAQNGTFNLDRSEFFYLDSSGTEVDTFFSFHSVLDNRLVSTERTVENVITQSSATISLAIKNDSTYLYGRVNQSMTMEDLQQEFPGAMPLAHVHGDTNQVVAFSVSKGEGKLIFLLSDPVFTNYCLSNPVNYDFVSDLVTHLPLGPILIDHYRTPFEGQQSSGNTRSLDRSPLSFILSFPPLRWAWYLLLTSIGLFLIFRTQRRQRVVPVINSLRNQSLEFARSLGILQFRTNRNHNNVAKEIISQFRNWSKRRFRSSIELDKEYEELLMKMRPEAKKNIRELFFIVDQVRKETPIDAEKLNKLYSITRYIYHHV